MVHDCWHYKAYAILSVWVACERATLVIRKRKLWAEALAVFSNLGAFGLLPHTPHGVEMLAFVEVGG